MGSDLTRSDLDTLISMEMKLRLLDLENITIPEAPPPVPKEPSSYNFTYNYSWGVCVYMCVSLKDGFSQCFDDISWGCMHQKKLPFFYFFKLLFNYFSEPWDFSQSLFVMLYASSNSRNVFILTEGVHRSGSSIQQCSWSWSSFSEWISIICAVSRQRFDLYSSWFVSTAMINLFIKLRNTLCLVVNMDGKLYKSSN